MSPQYESPGRMRWKWKIFSAIRDSGHLPETVEKLCPENWQKESFWTELNERGFFYDQVEGAMKAFFLREYPKYRDIETVCKLMWWTPTRNVYPEVVMGWCDPENTDIYDPIFEGKFRRLRNQIEAAQKIRSMELVGPALDVFKQELENATKVGADDNQKERGIKVAGKVLTGKKVLDDGPGVAIDQSKKVINIQRVEVVQQDGGMLIEEKLVDSNPS